MKSSIEYALFKRSATQIREDIKQIEENLLDLNLDELMDLLAQIGFIRDKINEINNELEKLFVSRGYLTN